jgi:hypothetical protein
LEYLSIQVAYSLERFIAGCAAVTSDDGLRDGAPDQHGERSKQVDVPKFDPNALDVEWRALPVGLMYEILDIPAKTEEADSCILGQTEGATPPDYWGWFEERQFQYATLGLNASSIVAQLRTLAGLPQRPPQRWDKIAYMKSRIDEIAQERNAREERYRKAFPRPGAPVSKDADG